MTQDYEHNICTKCGGTSLIRDDDLGEVVCASCGLVLSDCIVDTGPEWRAFNSVENASRSRAGKTMSYMLFDKGLSTDFNGYKDGKGKRLDIETHNKMNRLRRYDKRSKMDDTWARNLTIAMAELDRLGERLHIPSLLKEQAAVLYRKALTVDLIRGRSIDAFVAASIYAVCRLQKVPRSLKKISEESTREHSEISHSYRLLIKELGLKMPIDDPMKFVSGIASKLNLKQDTEFQAIEILREAREKKGLSGKEPRGIAAAALYMACISTRDKRIQKDVAQAAGTTEVTLRNRLRGLETILNN